MKVLQFHLVQVPALVKFIISLAFYILNVGFEGVCSTGAVGGGVGPSWAAESKRQQNGYFKRKKNSLL